MHRLIGLLLVASLAACGAGGSSSTPPPPDNQVTTTQSPSLLVPAARSPYNGGLDVGPGTFKRAYRHIVELMRSRKATNITWALHYNSENFPGTDPRNRPVAYYPGDDLVDWVGISAYGSERSNDQRCPTF